MSEEMKDMEKQNRETGEVSNGSEDTAARTGTEGTGAVNTEQFTQGGAGRAESGAAGAENGAAGAERGAAGADNGVAGADNGADGAENSAAAAGTETSENGTQGNEAEDAAKEAAGAAAAGTDAGEKKKGFFSRKKDKKDEQIDELTDRLKRNMAEFDNFRKRTEKEKAAMYEIGAKDIIEKILPVVDNFERGLATIPEGEERSAFAEGMDMIYKQLMKMLDEAGCKPIEAVGQPFDPNFHNAVMHVDDENLGENVVAEEFQKGYLYRDSVVRHSMVKVAN